MIVHWCGIARHCNSRLKQRTFIGLVLNRDSRRNRFQALKTGGWLEIRALLAAVQRGAALGTLAFPIHARWQRSGTTETAGRHYVLQEPWKAGSGNVDWRTRTARFRPLSKRAIPGLVAGIHVSALFVFTVVVHVSNRLLEFVLSHRHLIGVVGQGS
jgi:hypothetical protein